MNISFPESFLASYKPLRELGRGGMGFVVLAKKKDTEQLVAAKFLLPQFAQTIELRRFAREARVLFELNHKNIVRGIDVCGAAEEIPSVVLEYVQGGTLEQRLANDGPVGTGDAIVMIDAIGQGLIHAHDRGIIHRDLKPANVLIAQNSVLKISDFGLSALAEEKERLTKTGVIMGTPHYMAPEQIRSAKVDERADLYALSTIGFELLAGQRPYEKADLPSLLKAKLEKRVVRLPKVAPQIPTLLAEVIESGLRIDPSERPNSVRQFLDELHKAHRVNQSNLGKTATKPVKAKVEEAKETTTDVHKNYSVLSFFALLGIIVCIVFLWPSASDEWKDTLVVRTDKEMLIATWSSISAENYEWSLWKDGSMIKKGSTEKQKRNNRLTIHTLAPGRYTFRVHSQSGGSVAEKQIELTATGINGPVQSLVAFYHSYFNYDISGYEKVEVEIADEAGHRLVSRSAPPKGPLVIKLAEHFPKRLNWRIKFKDETFAFGKLSVKSQKRFWELKKGNEVSRLNPNLISPPLWLAGSPMYGDNSGLLDVVTIGQGAKRAWAYRPPDWSIHQRGNIAYAVVGDNRGLLVISRHKEERNRRLWLFDIEQRRLQWKKRIQNNDLDGLPPWFHSPDDPWFKPLSKKEYRIESPSEATMDPFGLGQVIGDEAYFCTISGPSTQIWYRWSLRKKEGHWLHLPQGAMARAPRMLWSNKGKNVNEQVDRLLQQPWHVRRTIQLLENGLLSLVSVGKAGEFLVCALCLCPVSKVPSEPSVLAMFQTQRRAPWLATFKDEGLAFVTAAQGLLWWSPRERKIRQCLLKTLLPNSHEHFLTGPVFGANGRFYVCYSRIPTSLELAKISLLSFTVSQGKIENIQRVRGFQYEDTGIHAPTIHAVQKIGDDFIGMGKGGLFLFQPNSSSYKTLKDSSTAPLRYMSCSPQGMLALVDSQCNQQIVPVAVVKSLPTIKLKQN